MGGAGFPRRLLRNRRWLCCLISAALFSCLLQVLLVLRHTETSSGGTPLSWQQYGTFLLWSFLTGVGIRNVIPLAQLIFPQLKDTVFCYPTSQFPGAEHLVAITIDDGVCRQGPSKSMLPEVLALLREESARATFFLSTDYVRDGDLESLVASGHELASHMPSDRSYADMEAPELRRALAASEHVLAPGLAPGARRWFRAPQARLTRAMAEVLRERNATHVLGDAYADDWAIPAPQAVADLYLRQCRSGSIAVLHMPERGFREHTLETLRLVLAGLRQRGLGAVSLGELDRAAHQGLAGESLATPTMREVHV